MYEGMERVNRQGRGLIINLGGPKARAYGTGLPE